MFIVTIVQDCYPLENARLPILPFPTVDRVGAGADVLFLAAKLCPRLVANTGIVLQFLESGQCYNSQKILWLAIGTEYRDDKQ